MGGCKENWGGWEQLIAGGTWTRSGRNPIFAHSWRDDIANGFNGITVEMEMDMSKEVGNKEHISNIEEILSNKAQLGC